MTLKSIQNISQYVNTDSRKEARRTEGVRTVFPRTLKDGGAQEELVFQPHLSSYRQIYWDWEAYKTGIQRKLRRRNGVYTDSLKTQGWNADRARKLVNLEVYTFDSPFQLQTPPMKLKNIQDILQKWVHNVKKLRREGGNGVTDLLSQTLSCRMMKPYYNATRLLCRGLRSQQCSIVAT